MRFSEEVEVLFLYGPLTANWSLGSYLNGVFGTECGKCRCVVCVETFFVRSNERTNLLLCFWICGVHLLHSICSLKLRAIGFLRAFRSSVSRRAKNRVQREADSGFSGVHPEGGTEKASNWDLPHRLYRKISSVYLRCLIYGRFSLRSSPARTL